MTSEYYEKQVIKLFKSGKPTKRQLQEMAKAVLYFSESEHAHLVYDIDLKVLGPIKSCDHCGHKMFSKTEFCNMCESAPLGEGVFDRRTS